MLHTRESAFLMDKMQAELNKCKAMCDSYAHAYAQDSKPEDQVLYRQFKYAHDMLVPLINAASTSLHGLEDQLPKDPDHL
jgi:hypothetical protein